MVLSYTSTSKLERCGAPSVLYRYRNGYPCLSINTIYITVGPRYNDSQGTEGNTLSIPGIDTSIWTFNCRVQLEMGVRDIR